MNKCQKFTPISYAGILLDAIDYSGGKILKKTFLENSCGEGNILMIAVTRYVEAALKKKMSKEEIVNDLKMYFIGFEVDKSVALKCKSNLDDILIEYNLPSVDWKIYCQDYLRSNINKSIDYIVGNPPYIMYQELETKDRDYLKNNFESCQKGKFDYCYAFIEKSLKDLGKEGRMSYLIPSSIFKNSFGLNLRNIIKDCLDSILDYPYTTVFDNALTSPAIITLSKERKSNYIKYTNADDNSEIKIWKKYLVGKWIFTKDYATMVQKRRANLKRFGDYFQVSNSVATLANKVFIFSNFERIDNFFIVNDCYIEESLVRRAASPRGMSRRLEEYIIFPYKPFEGTGFERYKKDQFEKKFSEAVKYLKLNEKKLYARKADGEWFEYGRSQALNKVNQPKLLMSSLITDKINIYELDEDVIPYSGFFIVPKKNTALEEAKKILESREFYSYIVKNSINANGHSVRCSVNDIMDFPLEDSIL